MPRAALPIALAVAALAAAPATASALDEQGYWAFADRMQTKIDRYWDDREGLYTGLNAGAHSDVLLTLAVAAQRDHQGPARNDRRARRIVDALVDSPPFVAKAPPRWKDAQTHAPGFVSSMHTIKSNQHLVVDSEVIDGLRYAWLARRELGLSTAQASAIADRIHRTAMGSYWRWPAIRLNQINWYALVYAANATVTGSPRLLRRDLRLQIARFVARARGSAGAAGNLGPGLRFNYLPHIRPGAPMNTDSAEYANIVASFTREYAQARRAGMRAPSPAARRLLRQWLMRVLAGYWTHGGYVNWDTGFGFRRWHQSKKLGLSQQALIGIATAPALAPHPSAPAWAKWMLDRGFEFYERELARNGDVPPGLFFGVHALPQPTESARLALARMSSNAARAIAGGLGSMRGKEPPPLYAFDPDTGRLAVTTPDYNTAIVPSSRGAYPYGGIDLARLFSGRQEVAAGIGGRPPASFGMLVRDISGRRAFATQLADRGRLRLTMAPHGVGARASAWTGRAYAGPFQDLRAAGISRGGGWTGRTTHRFTSFFVQTTWSLRRTGAGGRVSADVLFPSWGAEAEVTAVMRDGSTRRVGNTRIPLARITELRVRSRNSSYVVLPWRRPRGATVHLLHPRAQSSAPLAGPTLAVQVLRASRARTASFSARYAPVEREQAAETAARSAKER
jgi:hypothetical protein